MCAHPDFTSQCKQALYPTTSHPDSFSGFCHPVIKKKVSRLYLYMRVDEEWEQQATMSTVVADVVGEWTNKKKIHLLNTRNAVLKCYVWIWKYFHQHHHDRVAILSWLLTEWDGSGVRKELKWDKWKVPVTSSQSLSSGRLKMQINAESGLSWCSTNGTKQRMNTSHVSVRC